MLSIAFHIEMLCIIMLNAEDHSAGCLHSDCYYPKYSCAYSVSITTLSNHRALVHPYAECHFSEC
jgi:hypothetical protein